MDIDVLKAASAALMASLGMTSLLIGVMLGLYARPSWRTNAIIMAFGTGALIQALASELAFEGTERLIHEAHYSGLLAWSWVAAGFVMGGVLYYFGNRQLDQYGASLRHPALAKAYLMRKKRENSEELLSHLSQVSLLRSLPPEEMEDVLLCVEPVQFLAGQVIFSKGDEADGLYLIASGKVEIVDGRVTNGHATGKRIAELDAGQSFGETALLAKEHRTATVRAATDVSVLRIGTAQFEELLDNSQRLRQAVEALNTERILKNVTSSKKASPSAEEWKKIALANVERVSRREEQAMMEAHGTKSSPFALFLGAVLDGIPASVVIGASFASFESFKFTFLVAIFVSDIPEAIGSTLGMKQAGFSDRRIYGLWTLLIVASAIAAALGNIFLADASPVVITMVSAVAGGGILAMVASVMMPEAYENGGASVGLATIAGFLTAFFFVFV